MSFSALQRAEIAEIVKSYRLHTRSLSRFSALQRAEIAEIALGRLTTSRVRCRVSVLFNEPKLLKSADSISPERATIVSVLFNEPKLLKSPWKVTTS
jgi:hypothetical protein